jgi:uncharacterized membrane protein (DUF485 family)
MKMNANRLAVVLVGLWTALIAVAAGFAAEWSMHVGTAAEILSWGGLYGLGVLAMIWVAARLIA